MACDGAAELAMAQPPERGHAEVGLRDRSRVASSRRRTLRHPRQLPRRLAAAHAVPVAVQGVEHSLVQRRVRPVLGLIRGGRVGQRRRRVGRGSSRRRADTSCCAASRSSAPPWRGWRRRPTPRPPAPRPSSTAWFMIRHRLGSGIWPILRAQCGQRPLVVQPLGDAPAVEAQQLAAGVARQVQSAQAPHRRGVVRPAPRPRPGVRAARCPSPAPPTGGRPPPPAAGWTRSAGRDLRGSTRRPARTTAPAGRGRGPRPAPSQARCCDQRGGGRILRTHFGQQQRLVARAQPVAAAHARSSPRRAAPGAAVHPAALARARPAIAKVESRSSAWPNRATASA